MKSIWMQMATNSALMMLSCSCIIERRILVSHPVPVQKFTSTDRLEATAQIGFLERPTRPLDLAWRDIPIWAEPKKNLPIWIRLSAYNDVEKAIVGRQIKLIVINPAGEEISPSIASVSPKEVTTSSDGYSNQKIVFNASIFGIYRIAASYNDYKTIAVSYSQPILVFSQDESIPDELGINRFQTYAEDNRSRSNGFKIPLR